MASAAASAGTPALNQTYSPDRYGNLYFGAGTGPVYSYDTTTNRLTSVGSTTLGYDGAGELTWDGSNTDVYDGEGRLAWQYVGTNPNNYTNAEYYYNALGERVIRYNPAVGWEVLYNDPWGNETEVNSGGVQRVDYLPPVAGRQYAMYMNGITYFTHANALGSTGMITDQMGAPQQEVLYTPWGWDWASAGAGGNYIDMRFAGTLPWDPQGPETYNHAAPNRMMSPNYSRWMSPDPLGGDVSNPQSLNRYAYVMNNPTNLVDLLGLGPGVPGAPGYEDDCPGGVPDDNGNQGGGGGGGRHAPIIDDPFLIFRPGASGGTQVDRIFSKTFACSQSTSQLLSSTEQNFSSLASYQAGGTYAIFAPDPIKQGETIPITTTLDLPLIPRALTSEDDAVVVSSVTQTGWTFAAVPGQHPFKPGAVNFSATSAGPGQVNFSVHVTGNFASPFYHLGFLLGGDTVEANLWNGFLNNVANLCGGTQAAGAGGRK